MVILTIPSNPENHNRQYQEECNNAMLSLQVEIHSMKLKHKEELYWLHLELDTARREKESVEDRITDLYQDMLELVGGGQSPPNSGEPQRRGDCIVTLASVADANAMQKQLRKYEKMIIIMNNQITLLRNSTDTLLKSLKSEISDLIDEKTRSELSLMNQLADLDKENRELKFHVDVHQNAEKDQELANQRTSPPNDLNKLSEENCFLCLRINELEQEVRVARLLSKEASIDNMKMSQQQDQDAAEALLDRVTAVSTRSDESIHYFSSVMANLQLPKDCLTNDHERGLSLMETISLVREQVKMSLILVELQIRNCLAYLKNDRCELLRIRDGFQSDMDTSNFDERLTMIQNEAVKAIDRLHVKLMDRISGLEAESEHMSATLNGMVGARIGELQQMQSQQHTLVEEFLFNVHESNQAESTREEINPDDSSDMVVSRVVWERLQDEIVKILARIEEKNEEIVRLSAAVNELKVRERALKHETERILEDQSKIELQKRGTIDGP